MKRFILIAAFGFFAIIALASLFISIVAVIDGDNGTAALYLIFFCSEALLAGIIFACLKEDSYD